MTGPAREEWEGNSQMGVAEIQKMSPPTTGRCYQTKEWGRPTNGNGSAAQRHNSQSQLYSFFGVVDQTLTFLVDWTGSYF